MLDEKERIEVEQCIRDSIGWALNKDIDRLFSIMAQGENLLEVENRLQTLNASLII